EQQRREPTPSPEPERPLKSRPGAQRARPERLKRDGNTTGPGSSNGKPARERSARDESPRDESARTESARHEAAPNAGPGSDGKPRDEELEDLVRAYDSEREPLSLAEEIADDLQRRGTISDEHIEQLKKSEVHIAELQRMSMGELIEAARRE